MNQPWRLGNAVIYISSIFKCFETVSGIKSGSSGVVIPS